MERDVLFDVRGTAMVTHERLISDGPELQNFFFPDASFLQLFLDLGGDTSMSDGTAQQGA